MVWQYDLAKQRHLHITTISNSVKKINPQIKQAINNWIKLNFKPKGLSGNKKIPTIFT